MARIINSFDECLSLLFDNAQPTGKAMYIGNVELKNRLILAPLASMLRLSLRLTYRKLGAAMTCVGVIDAKAVAQGKEHRLINLLGHEEITDDREKPVCIQLIGADMADVVEAAKRIERFASIIDLNCSGPIKRVRNLGYGAVLLRNPRFIAELVSALVEKVSVPVTVKIRIGIKGDDVDVCEVARKCETAGASAIIVHARFASEGYAGPVHWDAIRAVKQSVGIPVVGNGGVHSALDAKAMLEKTGCDFVMIGTSAIINPLIFYQTNQLLLTGVVPKRSKLGGLPKFFREYAACARSIESKSTLKFLRRNCRNFLKMRSYMRKLSTGIVKLE